MENLGAYLRPTKPPLAFLLGSSCYGYTRYVLNSRHYAFQWPTNYARGARVVPENRGVEGKAKERERRERLESEGSLNGGTPFEELASDDTQVGGRRRDSTGIEPGIMRRTYVCGLHNPW